MKAEPIFAVPAVDDRAITGGATRTVNEYVAVALVEELVAVIVYVVEAETSVGVPEIKPVDELNPKPLGSEGAIE